MSQGLNKWMGIGNLGADPELRHTEGGQAVLNLRLACSESWLDKDGQKQERTEWVNCTLWGARAEGLAKILAKGERLYVEGSLRTRSFEKNGEKHYRTEVSVDDVKLLGGARPGDDRGGQQRDARDDRRGGGGGGRDDRGRSGGGQQQQQQRGRGWGNGGGQQQRRGDDSGGDDLPF